jgi:hypothetical protein
MGELGQRSVWRGQVFSSPGHQPLTDPGASACMKSAARVESLKFCCRRGASSDESSREALWYEGWGQDRVRVKKELEGHAVQKCTGRKALLVVCTHISCAAAAAHQAMLSTPNPMQLNS